MNLLYKLEILKENNNNQKKKYKDKKCNLRKIKNLFKIIRLFKKKL